MHFPLEIVFSEADFNQFDAADFPKILSVISGCGQVCVEVDILRETGLVCPNARNADLANGAKETTKSTSDLKLHVM